MAKTRIGVDVDGVIFRHHDKTVDALNAHFGVDIHPNDVTDYYYEKSYSRLTTLNEQDVLDYMTYLFDETDHLAEPAPILGMINALRVLNGMSLDPEGISIVTSRKPEKRGMTKAWIDHHGIAYKTIVHTTNKPDVCRSLRLRYFIEDSGVIAERLQAAGLGVFLIDTPYNRDIRATGSNGIWRITQPTDIPELIRKDLMK